MRKLKSILFINDFSSIKNKYGYRIKADSLISSSKLSSLSKTDKSILEKINVTDVIDLRSELEIEAAPDLMLNNSNYHRVSILENSDSPVVNKENRLQILIEKMTYPGGVKACVNEYYAKLVTSTLSLNGYKKALEIIKNAKGTVIYHCTQGKDRTGVLSCILLYILGFDRKTIYKNYKRYNKVTLGQTFAYTFGVAIRYFSIKKARSLSYVLVSRKEYLDHAYALILKEYGSIDNYLYKALNITKEDIKELQNKYLEK